MKDFITFLILLLLCFLIDNSKTQTVFNELENQDIIKNYYIEVKELNTNNFNDYFYNMEVIAVIPYINPIYSGKIIEFFLYDDIASFKRNYINILKQKGYYNEANKFILRPIVIEKVLVNASLNNIYTSLNSKEYTIIEN